MSIILTIIIILLVPKSILHQFGQHTRSIIRGYVAGLCILATMNAFPVLPLNSRREHAVFALMRVYDYISMLGHGYRVSE
jgi:cyanate permease